MAECVTKYLLTLQMLSQSEVEAELVSNIGPESGHAKKMSPQRWSDQVEEAVDLRHCHNVRDAFVCKVLQVGLGRVEQCERSSVFQLGVCQQMTRRIVPVFFVAGVETGGELREVKGGELLATSQSVVLVNR